MTRTLVRSALLAAATLATLVAARTAEAAPPYVERGLTLPAHDWSFDVGVGITHEDRPNPTLTGPGLNFEFAVAPIENLELGFRDGLRFGDDARIVHADEAGRLFDRETFGSIVAGGDPRSPNSVNEDIVANPEARIRGRLVHGRVAELALEGRVYLPIEQRSRFGIVFGMPLAFHLGDKARIDTGVYTPVLFYDKTYYAFDAPLNVWFQVTPKFWLGPMTGIRYQHQDAPAPVAPFDHTSASLGCGFGYQLTRGIDMKWMILSPHITDDQGARDFELGFGFQFRIE